MWDRIEIKKRGKEAFLKNYWGCVLISLILMLVLGNDFFQVRFDIRSRHLIYDGMSMFRRPDVDGTIRLIPVSVVAAVLIVVLGLVLTVFVTNVLSVGGCRYFLENQTMYVDVGLLGWGFSRDHYKNVVLTLFLRDLYTFLWTLLFIAPGIVKSYEYRMIPYILAEHPDMPPGEVFAKSREMMDGFKYEMLVLDVSFLGWMILGSVTFGIAAALFVEPYMNAAYAETYTTLKKIEDMQVVYQM